jgi:5-methylcytosine-specific restriction endonuclease McrA
MAKSGIDKSKKDEVLKRQKGLCAVCNQPLDMVATHFDLVRPWKKEGDEEANELHALCASCHAKKARKG